MKSIITIIMMAAIMAAPSSNSIHQFTMTSLEGEDVSLEKFKGKALLIVNVASKCGLTPQYEDLQKLYDERNADGLEILGFPANNFAGQEPGTDSEIKEFCTKNYGVTFPMFSKISVKGDDMHPLYQFLTEKEKNGVMDSKVKWNFQKYLIDKDGQLVAMIPPSQSVLSSEVQSQIDELFK
jgi:glutathione peroxidase